MRIAVGIYAFITLAITKIFVRIAFRKEIFRTEAECNTARIPTNNEAIDLKLWIPVDKWKHARWKYIGHDAKAKLPIFHRNKLIEIDLFPDDRGSGVCEFIPL